MPHECHGNSKLCKSHCLFQDKQIQANNKENTKATHFCPFVKGIHWWPLLWLPSQGPVIWEVFSWDDLIMYLTLFCYSIHGVWLLTRLHGVPGNFIFAAMYVLSFFFNGKIRYYNITSLTNRYVPFCCLSKANPMNFRKKIQIHIPLQVNIWIIYSVSFSHKFHQIFKAACSFACVCYATNHPSTFCC